MKDILYCFISHETALKDDISRIGTLCACLNIKDYVIVCGNSSKNYIDNHILYLHCDDTYEGLPDKIHKMFAYLYNNQTEYEYYAKLDRLTIIKNPLNISNMTGDYCGSWVKVKNGFDGDRLWHKNKCSPNSIWNNKPYPGEFIPWCRGWGYFLSRKAAGIISCHPPDPNYHIYEDLYVSQILLRKADISPTHLSNIRDFITDPESEF